jgi:hypothetical protein
MGSGDPRAEIRTAYRLAYGRMPTEEEERAAMAFLRAQATMVEPAVEDKQPGTLADSSGHGLTRSTDRSSPSASTDPHAAALIDFCHALLISNEFLYVD